MKVCPICKSRCFDDMDTCYGCLHNFAKEYDDDVFSYPETPNTTEIPQLTQFSESPKIPGFDQIPDYFELDTFPQIEDSVLPQHRHSSPSVFAELPEYFELDCFPQIEDVSTQHVPQHSHNHLNELPFNDSEQFNYEDKIKVSIEIPKSLLKTLT